MGSPCRPFCSFQGQMVKIKVYSLHNLPLLLAEEATLIL